MKRKQYEESNRRPSRKDEENKKRSREEKKAKSKDARYSSSDEKVDIILLREVPKKGKAVCRNKSRKILNGGGETSKYKGGNKLIGEDKGNKKLSSHQSVDAYVISSDDDDDFDGPNSTDAESLESVSFPSAKEQVAKLKKHSGKNLLLAVGSKNRKGKNKYVPSAKEDVVEVRKCFKKNPHFRVGSRNRKGKNKSVEEHGEDSSSDGIVFLDDVKDTKKGKNLQRGAEKASSNTCKTSTFKVGDKVQQTCREAETSRKQPNCSYEEAILLTSEDDGDSIGKSGEDEKSVPSSTDSDSEEPSDTTEDSSSTSGDLEDRDYEIPDHKTLEKSESNSSSDDEESRSSSSELNVCRKSIRETGRKSAQLRQFSNVVESGSSTSSQEDSVPKEEKVGKENEEINQLRKASRRETGRKSAQWHQFSKVVESGSSTSSQEDSVPKEEKVGKENEETNQLMKASRQRLETKEDDTFNILANSILHQGDMLEKMAFEQRVEKPVERDAGLPLKFSFDDEIPEPPEKSDRDKEVEELFSEMFFALECESMNSDSQPKSNEEHETSTSECDHVYVLDEEIGLICTHCRHIKTEIRYIFPLFATRAKRFARGESSRKEKDAGTLGFDSSSDCNRNAFFETDGTVWDRLHGVRHTLYQHQREGFEFLWRNIGGSINLSQLGATSSEIGGCIISHAPGTGKTRLAILFIESYLKLFPGSRPLIIAPVNILNTWEEEIEKWNVEFPFHNLNRHEPSGKENKTALEFMSRNIKQNNDVVRMVKLFSWDKEDSILGVGYSLLEKLAGKETRNSKRGEKRKRKVINEELKEESSAWRNILLEKPGLVILDEGHRPRNHRSSIWKILVKLQTRKIIILSGTPFQNNFDELLNSLHLIRPEVEKALREERTFTDLMPNLKNSRHQNQGRQSDPSKDEARGKAIDKLKASIESFVHVHKGSILQKTLPGLREYAIILNPTEIQKSLFQKVEKSSNTFGLECQVALISVHPQLLKLYSSIKESSQGKDKLDYSTLDPNEGVKLRFVLEIVRLSVILDEKVLIFSQYIEPLHLIRYQLEKKFKWQEGQQIFMVKGKLPQNNRQKIIHSFNDPKSEAKVLLASTKCCSEGISLVGASRVVMLDVVWNPSVAMQAISRAYRIGQKKMVYAYHLMISGTSEDDKYRRQAEKERMSELVFTCTNAEVDEHSKTRIVASDEKILEAIKDHLKNIIERVIEQPKESSFFRENGLPSES